MTLSSLFVASVKYAHNVSNNISGTQRVNGGNSASCSNLVISLFLSMIAPCMGSLSRRLLLSSCCNHFIGNMQMLLNRCNHTNNFYYYFYLNSITFLFLFFYLLANNNSVCLHAQFRPCLYFCPYVSISVCVESAETNSSEMSGHGSSFKRTETSSCVDFLFTSVTSAPAALIYSIKKCHSDTVTLSLTTRL